MPQLAGSRKALRQSISRRKTNRQFKEELKKAVIAFDAKPSPKLLDTLFSLLDKSVKKHLNHHNKVNRLKAQFTKKLTPAKPVTSPTKPPVKKSSSKKKTTQKLPKKTTIKPTPKKTSVPKKTPASKSAKAKKTPSMA